jgi:hypothetical protein
MIFGVTDFELIEIRLDHALVSFGGNVKEIGRDQGDLAE